jgi:hypothetical protein
MYPLNNLSNQDTMNFSARNFNLVIANHSHDVTEKRKKYNTSCQVLPKRSSILTAYTCSDYRLNKPTNGNCDKHCGLKEDLPQIKPKVMYSVTRHRCFK